MYLSTLRIRNYKSFHDSGEICFKPGINVVIGPNNSGKTALLEALSLRFGNKPHKSEEHGIGGGYNSQSSVEFAITVDSDEIQSNEDDYSWMIVPGPADGRYDDLATAFNQVREKGLTIQGTATANGVSHQLNYGLYQQNQAGYNTSFMSIQLGDDGRYVASSPEQDRLIGRKFEDTIGWRLVEPLANEIYRFVAERMKLSTYPFESDSSELLPDAQNLAAVLQVLYTNNISRYEKLITYVSSVIPSVKWVSSVPNITEGTDLMKTKKKEVTIKIWPVDRNTEKEELAIDLSEAGTGIGQVLAMLYVVYTSRRPRTIIIDEPQSFLHPGAIRKLFEILHSFPQHQYFISTHSPDVLSAAKPSTITALNYEEGVSTATSLNLSQTNELRDVLNQIGVRFSDLFFASNILWVEGVTEASAFPLLLEGSGTANSEITVLPLTNTGDLRSKKYAKKHAKLVFDIYQKLSGAHALAPPVIGVILDQEDTSAHEIKELKKLSDGLLHFLPRRMYENYLLDPDAIAAVANHEDNFSSTPLTVEQLSEWISQKRAAKEYLADRLKNKELSDSQWLGHVDGARFLEDIFRHFSGVVEYVKTKHSLELTKWLLENKPEALSDLRSFLESINSTG